MGLFYGRVLKTPHGNVKAIVQVYVFKENDIFIAYSPSFDFISYGYSMNEAKEEFDNVFTSQISYLMKQGTIYQYLRDNGWEFKDGKLIAPTIDFVRKHSEIFRNKIDNKNVESFNYECIIPAA